ncbi:MAG: hypothetical protein Q7J31_04545 [Syntrophales bacterium]|nr:hypothetical protein [Syntrophales bacterium]
MGKRRYWICIITLTLLIGITIASFGNVVCAKEVDLGADALLQESPIQPHSQEKPVYDLFNIAIIGISLGCMLYVSSVHWHSTERRQIEVKIHEMDSFLTNTCAVDFFISSNNDADPMVNNAQAMQVTRDRKLKDLKDHKDTINNGASEIETEILRMLG